MTSAEEDTKRQIEDHLGFLGDCQKFLLPTVAAMVAFLLVVIQMQAISNELKLSIGVVAFICPILVFAQVLIVDSQPRNWQSRQRNGDLQQYAEELKRVRELVDGWSLPCIVAIHIWMLLVLIHLGGVFGVIGCAGFGAAVCTRLWTGRHRN